jgi:hypothetical protein
MNISSLISLANLIKQHTGIAHYEWVTTDTQLSKKIGDLKSAQFPLLVVVTPSYGTDAPDNDNVRDISQMLFFVLKRNKFQSATGATEIADTDETLAIARQIKSYLINGFPGANDCIIPAAIEPASFNIDPEWNYLGCDGWSISFQMKY